LGCVAGISNVVVFEEHLLSGLHRLFSGRQIASHDLIAYPQVGGVENAPLESVHLGYTQAEQERQELGLDPNAFALYTALHPLTPDLTPAQARLVDALFTHILKRCGTPSRSRSSAQTSTRLCAHWLARKR
jgi:hypothetical protein